MLLLHEPRYVQCLCFFTCKQLWITKNGKEEDGWKRERKSGREGRRSQNRQLRAAVSGYGWAALLFQSDVRYFSPHQLVLRRWQLVQFGASRWPIVRAFSPCRVRVSPTRLAPCRQIIWSDHVDTMISSATFHYIA